MQPNESRGTEPEYQYTCKERSPGDCAVYLGLGNTVLSLSWEVLYVLFFLLTYEQGLGYTQRNSLLHNPCGLTRTLMKERRKQENKLSLLSPTRATTSVSSTSSSVSQGGDLEHLHQNNWALVKRAKFETSPRSPELQFHYKWCKSGNLKSY